MSDAIRQTIEILEHEIEALEQRRGELLRAVDALRPLADPAAPAHNGAGRRRTVVSHASKSGPSVTRASAALDHHNWDQARTDAVLQLLADGPLPTKTIASRLRQDKRVMKQALQRLKKSGALNQVGHGPGTKWVLPRGAAKEAP